MTTYPAIHTGDCLAVMPTLAPNSVDSIVTDPPYGLSFMGNDWDHGVPGVHFWREALRVAKSGAFLLAFGGTRTFHRLAVAVEDGGWEIRDTVMWVYGGGFPKSFDVGKAIDKAAGAEREVLRARSYEISDGGGFSGNLNTTKPRKDSSEITAPATAEAQQWDGWGTALKPAWEPIIVARKPLIGTVAENVLRFGTGAINVDAGRVGSGGQLKWEQPRDMGYNGGNDAGIVAATKNTLGRWPANLIHDGSDEVLGLMPEANVHKPSGISRGETSGYQGGWGDRAPFGYDDTTGSAARFFYCAKASKADRDEGCEGLEERLSGGLNKSRDKGQRMDTRPGRTKMTQEEVRGRNHHPTVKPTALMRYLVKLVTRRGGVVLDPFMGSGSTGKACAHEGMAFIGIDLSPEYCEIAARRIAAVSQLSLLEAQA